MRRLALLGLCLVGMLAATAQGAQAAPHWFVKEPGVFGGWTAVEGFVEAMPQETLRSEGEMTITSNSPSGRLRPISECLARGTALVEDPSSKTLPGTAMIERFEGICEKETGGLNAASPYPCRLGEPFEFRIAGGSWAGQLEQEGTKVFLALPSVDLEVECDVSHERAQYTGPLKPQVTVGRLRFLGATTGELEDGSTGHRFNLKGTEFITPVLEKYIVLRVGEK